jgi:uncharacterized protein (TIGR03437 family)
VLSPTHLVANMVAAPNAAIGTSEISVLSGFQLATEPGGFQVQPANPSIPFVGLPIVNADPTQSNLYPGATVSIYGLNLAATSNSTQITLNGQSVQVLYSSPTQVNFAIPSNFPTGLATLVLNNGATAAPSLWLEIDNPPPVIQQVAEATGQILTASFAASAGDVLVANVSNVPASVAGNSSEVEVTVSGLPMAVLQVAQASQPGTVAVSFVVSQSFGGATVPVVVTVQGASSSPYEIVVH